MNSKRAVSLTEIDPKNQFPRFSKKGPLETEKFPTISRRFPGGKWKAQQNQWIQNASFQRFPQYFRRQVQVSNQPMYGLETWKLETLHLVIIVK
jgi:hypothetical protein